MESESAAERGGHEWTEVRADDYGVAGGFFFSSVGNVRAGELGGD